MNRQRHKQHPEVLILMLGVGVFAAMVVLSQFEVQERFFGNHHQHPYETVDAEHHVTTGVYTSRDGVVHDGHAEARERARAGGEPASVGAADVGAAGVSSAGVNSTDVNSTGINSGGINSADANSAGHNPVGINSTVHNSAGVNPAGANHSGAQVSNGMDASPPLDLAGGPAQGAATDDVPDFRPPVKSAREVYLELRKQEEAKQAEAMTKQAEATAMALRVEAAKVAAENEAAVKAAAAKEAALKELAEKDAILKAQVAKDAAIRQRLLASASGGNRLNSLPSLPLPPPPGGGVLSAATNTSATNTSATSSVATNSLATNSIATNSANSSAGNNSASVQSMMPGSTSLRNTLPGSKFVSMAQSRGVNVPLADDAVSSTVTRFYGATFVADPKLKLPAKAMFEKPADSRAYQKTIPLKRFYMGGYRVSLQAPAADALIAAQKEASATHLKITPVGDVASLRSYEDTSYIWHKYLDKGLSYWVGRKKITPAQAHAILSSPPKKQLSQVIALEQKGLYLHANHAHSILNLAAPPGSSQHISGLALDIEEHQNANVRAILNRHGWYQTVAHDFPHFIYLGRPVNELPQLGLTSIKSDGRQFWVPDVPDNLPSTLR